MLTLAKTGLCRAQSCLEARAANPERLQLYGNAWHFVRQRDRETSQYRALSPFHNRYRQSGHAAHSSQVPCLSHTASACVFCGLVPYRRICLFEPLALTNVCPREGVTKAIAFATAGCRSRALVCRLPKSQVSSAENDLQ